MKLLLPVRQLFLPINYLGAPKDMSMSTGTFWCWSMNQSYQSLSDTLCQTTPGWAEWAKDKPMFVISAEIDGIISGTNEKWVHAANAKPVEIHTHHIHPNIEAGRAVYEARREQAAANVERIK